MDPPTVFRLDLNARVRTSLGALAATAHRRPHAPLAVAALLVALALPRAARIRLDADLSSLLPRSFASVQGLEALRQRLGGTGYVAVVGMNGEPDRLERFAEDVASRLRPLPEIAFVELRRPKSFFEDRVLYYLDHRELEDLRHRLADRLRREKLRRNPFYVSLDEEDGQFDPSAFGQRAAGRTYRRFLGGSEELYLDRGERLVAVLAKPARNSSDLTYARNVVDRVEGALRDLDPARYGPDFRFALTGSYKKKVDQQRQISHDVRIASAVAAALIVLYLLLHFRSVRVGLVALVPVGVGIAWTYGLAGAAYGRLNLLTAFFGAILGGLGIEHGIHLLGRYRTLRAEGHTAETAVTATFAHTGASAVISAFVASLTLGGLAVSEFRAFREFGVIAAFGMVAVVAAYVLVLPATLGLLARLGWDIGPAARARSSHARPGRILARVYRPAALVSAIVVAILLVATPPVRFDYDLGSLEDASLPSFVLDHKVNRLLGRSQTPVALLADRPAEQRGVVSALHRRQRERGEASGIDFAVSLADLVPDQQNEKRPTIEAIGRLVAGVDADALTDDLRSKLEDLRRAVLTRPFGVDDLPASVRRHFGANAGASGGIVLVFPRISLADGAKVRKLAQEVREVQLPGGGQVTAAGEPLILADILEMVTRDGPVILSLALLAALVTTSVGLGSLGAGALSLVPTLVSLLALTGVMPLLGVELNYLNVLAVPLLIGVTVDASVHMLARLAEPTAAFPEVYAETGRAIVGGLLTSAVGFGALLMADHPGLYSVGRLVLLGFAVNLVVTLVAFPALLLWLRDRTASRRRLSLPGATPSGGHREGSQVLAAPETPNR